MYLISKTLLSDLLLILVLALGIDHDVGQNDGQDGGHNVGQNDGQDDDHDVGQNDGQDDDHNVGQNDGQDTDHDVGLDSTLKPATRPH